MEINNRILSGDFYKALKAAKELLAYEQKLMADSEGLRGSMTNPALAYAKTAQQTLQGRALEAHVLLKSAARLQAIRDSWPAREAELQEALLANRKIWTVFVTAMTQP